MAGRPVSLEYWQRAVEKRAHDVVDWEARKPAPAADTTMLRRWEKELARKRRLKTHAESVVAKLQAPTSVPAPGPASGVRLWHWRERVAAYEKMLADITTSLAQHSAAGTLTDHRRKHHADSTRRTEALLARAKAKVEDWELRAATKASAQAQD